MDIGNISLLIGISIAVIATIYFLFVEGVIPTRYGGYPVKSVSIKLILLTLSIVGLLRYTSFALGIKIMLVGLIIVFVWFLFP